MSLRKAFHLVIVVNLVLCTSFVPLAAKSELISTPASPTTVRDVCASDCTYSSIQAAINDSGPGDIIDLAAETFTEPITINEDITLSGAGAGSTIIQAGSTPTNATQRVVTVLVTTTVTIQGVTIRYGKTSGGGGIHNRGVLTVTNSIITNNNVTNNGAGIFNNGKDSVDHAVLTIIDSVISNNTGGNARGGGIYNYANNGDATINLIRTEIHGNSNQYGGGISNYANYGVATLNLSQTQIYNNSGTAQGGGIDNWAWNLNSEANISIWDSTIDNNTILFNGGGLYNHSFQGVTDVELFNSTISYNTAYDFGGGIYNYADGYSSDIALTNVTISYNSADDGAGIYNYGKRSPANINIIASTINSNIAASDYTGGIYNDRLTDEIGSSAIITMTGSILANNVDYDCNTVVAHGAVFNNTGYNIIETNVDGSCGTAITDDPALGPLQDNGGPTFTHALLEGSPAIDAIPPGFCLVSMDQRGVMRPIGDGCDIGAYEYGFLAFLPLIIR